LLLIMKYKVLCVVNSGWRNGNRYSPT
jgi:hypothetical protein